MGSNTLFSAWEESRLLLGELCQAQPESGGQGACLSYLHSGAQKQNRAASFFFLGSTAH